MSSSNEEPSPKRARSGSTTPPSTTSSLTATTPSTLVATATSAGSRTDYTCYTMTKNNRILAVVIETKMNSSQDALAQVYPQFKSLSLK